MQGDPKYPKQAITTAQLARMIKATDAWSRAGKIDAAANLAKQRIWLFHGYNDGVVKASVTEALYAYYAHYINPSQIFYKDNLNAGHAQITASCPDTGNVCNLCDKTGGNFMNRCPSDGQMESVYDAAGSLLQHIYGTLAAKASGPLRGRVVEFSQKEFSLDSQGNQSPLHLSMADTGYAYVPADCEAMAACRVHIAFHGCQQSAERIKDAFYRYAGYNEWADTNRLIILYPQTVASYPVLPSLPVNPQGCWDWWGYNDYFDSKGRYATRDGLQIAAIRRMLDRLAGANAATAQPASPEGAFGPPSQVVVGDSTNTQVLLRWTPVNDAASYDVYRATTAGGPYAKKVNTGPVARTTFVDHGLSARTKYFYVVRAVNPSGVESEISPEVSVVTSGNPPPCDPYFSLTLGPVTKANQPTTRTCQ